MLCHVNFLSVDGGFWNFGESPRPCPLILTVDTGRGQSRWFRGEDSFNLIEAYLHFGVALSRNLGYPPKTRR